MKKLLKFFLIFVCLFIFSLPSVYAVGIDMNLSNSNNNITNNSVDNNAINNNTINNNLNDNNSTSNVPRVSTSQTSEEFSLSVSDIIDIILIAVGIVLILLAIAILLKIR